jgi:hypothetical protein
VPGRALAGNAISLSAADAAERSSAQAMAAADLVAGDVQRFLIVVGGFTGPTLVLLARHISTSQARC